MRNQLASLSRFWEIRHTAKLFRITYLQAIAKKSLKHPAIRSAGAVWFWAKASPRLGSARLLTRSSGLQVRPTLPYLLRSTRFSRFNLTRILSSIHQQVQRQPRWLQPYVIGRAGSLMKAGKEGTRFIAWITKILVCLLSSIVV